MTKLPHKEKVTVIAKTYPECSQKYGCLICTAGINEDGEWRRLYPIPWYMLMRRDGEKTLNYKKWDVIEVTVEKAHPDFRKESYKVIQPERIRVVESISDWNDRRAFVQKYLDSDMEALREGKRSLGFIKPNRLHDFVEKERHKLSDEGEKDLLEKSIQSLLPEFESTSYREQYWKGLRPREIPWIGYHYTCKGEDCNDHQMMCIDWEIQELYRRVGYEKTRQKALDWMRTRDLYFGVGTTWRFPTWMIISLVYPPKTLVEPLIRTLGREPESLKEREGKITGQLKFGDEGLEGQERMD